MRWDLPRRVPAQVLGVTLLKTRISMVKQMVTWGWFRSCVAVESMLYIPLVLPFFLVFIANISLSLSLPSLHC